MSEILALVVTVDSAEVELASDALWGLGVVAIEERVSPGQSSQIELWTSLGDDSAAVVLALNALDPRWPRRFESVDPQVSETWRAFAETVTIDDDLIVYPAWKQRPRSRARVKIAIEPGATFGLGDHPTTVLSLRALKRALSNRTQATVLDVGCGSGVLAVAACLLGADHAVAIDISPASVPTTIQNAQLNGVPGRVQVSTTNLGDVVGEFGVVVANILAPTLIELSGDLRRTTAPRGALIISGVLAGRHQHVLAALEPFIVSHRDELDGWAAITLVHPGNA